MLNRIIIMGRLARDPELRRTQSGVPVASFRLAVDRDFKDKSTGERSTDWIDVVAWRATAEFVSRFFTKGRMAVVEGRLQCATGPTRTATNVWPQRLSLTMCIFGDSKRDGDAPSYGGSYGSAPWLWRAGRQRLRRTASRRLRHSQRRSVGIR